MPSFRQSSCSESWCSCFTVLTNNEEQILSLKNRFFVWRTENHSAVNLFRSYEPSPTNLRPRPFLQLTTRILQLILCSFQPPTTVSQKPDPEQEYFSDEISPSDQITLICLLFLVFASWHVSASITSPDVLPGITSRRSRPHFLPEAASLLILMPPASDPQPRSYQKRRTDPCSGIKKMLYSVNGEPFNEEPFSPALCLCE